MFALDSTRACHTTVFVALSPHAICRFFVRASGMPLCLPRTEVQRPPGRKDLTGEGVHSIQGSAYCGASLAAGPHDPSAVPALLDLGCEAPGGYGPVVRGYGGLKRSGVDPPFCSSRARLHTAFTAVSALFMDHSVQECARPWPLWMGQGHCRKFDNEIIGPGVPYTPLVISPPMS